MWREGETERLRAGGDHLVATGDERFWTSAHDVAWNGLTINDPRWERPRAIGSDRPDGLLRVTYEHAQTVNPSLIRALSVGVRQLENDGIAGDSGSESQRVQRRCAADRRQRDGGQNECTSKVSFHVL